MVWCVCASVCASCTLLSLVGVFQAIMIRFLGVACTLLWLLMCGCADKRAPALKVGIVSQERVLNAGDGSATYMAECMIVPCHRMHVCKATCNDPTHSVAC